MPTIDQRLISKLQKENAELRKRVAQYEKLTKEQVENFRNLDLEGPMMAELDKFAKANSDVMSAIQGSWGLLIAYTVCLNAAISSQFRNAVPAKEE